MQMLCKVAAGFSDVRCPICGQGFLVYWTRSREITRYQQRVALQQSLREQHVTADTADIHAPAFQLPDTPATLSQQLPQPLAARVVPVYN